MQYLDRLGPYMLAFLAIAITVMMTYLVYDLGRGGFWH